MGYDTREVLAEIGWSEDEIAAADASGEVKCYDGSEMPESVLRPSYGLCPAGPEEAAAMAAARAAEEAAAR